MAGSSTAELRLRPTGEDDLDYVVAAEADPENSQFLAPSPREEHLGFLRDPAQRHLIAERGYGRAALRLAMARAFDKHDAHRLWLDVKPHNERARSLYRSAGFVEEGLLRDALYHGDRFESLIVMSMLRPEWQR